jgi:hypothetical protein
MTDASEPHKPTGVNFLRQQFLGKNGSACYKFSFDRIEACLTERGKEMQTIPADAVPKFETRKFLFSSAVTH